MARAKPPPKGKTLWSSSIRATTAADISARVVGSLITEYLTGDRRSCAATCGRRRHLAINHFTPGVLADRLTCLAASRTMMSPAKLRQRRSNSTSRNTNFWRLIGEKRTLNEDIVDKIPCDNARKLYGLP